MEHLYQFCIKKKLKVNEIRSEQLQSMSCWISDLKIGILNHWLQVFLHLVFNFAEPNCYVSFRLHTSLSDIGHILTWGLEDQLDSLFKILIIAINDLSDSWDSWELKVEARILCQDVSQLLEERIHPCATVNFHELLNSLNCSYSDGWSAILEVGGDERL